MEKFTQKELLGMIPSNVCTSNLTKSQKVVLGQLYVLNNLDESKNNGFFYVSNKDLSNLTSLSEPTIIAAVTKLELEKIITRKSGKRDANGSKASEYKIINNNKIIEEKDTVTMNENLANQVLEVIRDYNRNMSNLISILNSVTKQNFSDNFSNQHIENEVLTESILKNLSDDFSDYFSTDTESDTEVDTDKELNNNIINNNIIENNNINNLNKNNNIINNKEKENIIINNNILEKESASAIDEADALEKEEDSPNENKIEENNETLIASTIGEVDAEKEENDDTNDDEGFDDGELVSLFETPETPNVERKVKLTPEEETEKALNLMFGEDKEEKKDDTNTDGKLTPLEAQKKLVPRMRVLFGECNTMEDAKAAYDKIINGLGNYSKNLQPLALSMLKNKAWFLYTECITKNKSL